MRAKQPPATLGAIFRAHYVSILFTLAYALGSLAYLFPEHYSYYELQTSWRGFSSLLLGMSYTYIAAIGFWVQVKWIAALMVFGMALVLGLLVEALWKASLTGKFTVALAVIPNLLWGVFIAPPIAQPVECDKQFHLGDTTVSVRLFVEWDVDIRYVSFLVSSIDGERWQQDQRLSSPFQDSDTTCANFQGDEHAVVLLNRYEIYTRTTASDEWRRDTEWDVRGRCTLDNVHFDDPTHGAIELTCTEWIWIQETGRSQRQLTAWVLNTTDGGANWSITDEAIITEGD